MPGSMNAHDAVIVSIRCNDDAEQFSSRHLVGLPLSAARSLQPVSNQRHLRNLANWLANLVRIPASLQVLSLVGHERS